MEHHFNVETASEYGVLESVLLNNLWFWICHNRANDKNYHDGYYWTYNSVKALKELFPYASEKKIRNALKHLEDEGVIITGNYNASAYDRTMWYAITEKGVAICQKGQIDLPKRANGNTEKGKPIPNKKTDNKTIDIKQYIQTDNDALIEAYREFIKMRKQIKKPLTERAFKMIIKKLSGITSDEAEQIEILDQSILHNWQDVYPIKKDQKKQPNGNRDNVAHRDYNYEEMEKLLF